MNNYSEKDRLNVYESIIDNAEDIILLLTYEGKILSANKKAAELYGYAKEELLTMSIFDLRGRNQTGTVKKALEMAKASVEFQALHYRKDGTSFKVEVKATGIEIGEDGLILSIIRDISYRLKREEQIRELASIFREFSRCNNREHFRWNHNKLEFRCRRII
jgi:PAS domain S-box-containing protein